jgi:uncharacterized protein
MLAMIAVLAARDASAQCESTASSCVSCHEAQGLRPVLQAPQAWHRDHSFGDLCAACHGGDPLATAAAAAHASMSRPLADPATSCGGCHAEDFSERAERYVAAAAAAVDAPPPPSPTDRPRGGGTGVNLALAGVAGLLGISLFVILRRELAPARGRRQTLGAWLAAPGWNPVAAGVGLGVVVAISVAVCGRPIAVSGAFDKLAAYVGEPMFPASPYYRYVMSPGITWQVWLIVGVLAGAFASSRLAGQARVRWLPDTQWAPRFGASRRLRLALAFVGAMLVQIGAGIAGGCTSGLAISGGAVLAPAAFLFMTGMFAGGIPTAWLWYRGRRSA